MKKKRLLAIIFVFVIVFNIVSPLDTILASNSIEYEHIQEETKEEAEEESESPKSEEVEVTTSPKDTSAQEETKETEALKETKESVMKLSGRSINEYITNFTVSEHDIYDGGKIVVRLDFAEGNGNIQGGDVINISWPTSSGSEAYFEGYAKTKPLLIQGQHVADLIVTSDGARIVFNDLVNDLDDVEGWAEFEILGRNVTDTSGEDTKNVTITAGNREQSVNITKPESGTSSIFYYKTGDIQPNDTDHVRWFLGVNNNQAYVSEDIRIEDTIGQGQKLDPDSFEISVYGANPNHYSGKSGLEDFSRDFPGAGISYDEVANTITVYIPTQYASLNNFSIMYLTEITDYNLEGFDNFTKAWYKEHGEPEVNGEDVNAYVDNIYSGGGVSGAAKGELKLYKLVDGTKIGIPNVQFELKRTDGNEIINGEKIITLTTDENGLINIKKLPEGDYQVKEVAAPEWIDFISEESETLDFSVKASDVAGTVLEVENSKKTISVTASKTWENAPETKPTVELQLYKNNVAEGNPVSLANGTTKHTWENLPISDDAGNIYEYTVKEVGEDSGIVVLDSEKYEVTVKEVSDNEFAITNKFIPEKKNYEVQKNWDDKDNQDGKRPESITIKLLADGEETGKTLELNNDNNWYGEFTNLESKTSAGGKEINYTIKEVEVEGYTPEIVKRETSDTVENSPILGIIGITGTTETNGFVITNKYEPETKTIEGSKTWNDNENQDGKRPESITVKLQAGTEVVKELEVTEEDNWSWKFENLPMYKNGEKIEYKLEEVAVEGYETKIENFNITNSYTPETTTIEGSKTWDDSENQDGKRPESITVKLQAGTEVVKELEVTEEDNWSWKFENLPMYKNGEKIEYKLEEVAVEGYETKIENFNITNSYTPETTTIEGSKTWDDSENQDGKRPESITVKLQAGTEVVKELEVTEEDNWSWKFENLPMYKNGEKIEYKLEEVAVEGYETKIENFNITNSYTPETTTIEGSKTWDDSENQDGKRPESITVKLQAGTEVVKELEVTEEDNWSWKFENLPMYKNGEKIEYKLEEVAVEGYETKVENFNITNSYTPKKIDIPVTKQWEDENNKENKRPESITVKLLASGEETGDTLELNESNNWTGSFENLDQKKQGEDIAYTVEELAVEGYESSVTGEIKEGFTIINTLIPAEVYPEKPTDPKESKPTETATKKPTNKQSSSSKEKESKKLPKTGIYNEKALIFMGLAVVAVGSIIFKKDKRA